jgi:molybdenum cofactor cytidylyltransferase
VTTDQTCILVDDELLRQINCTSSVVIATAANFAYATANQRVATVKSTPFAVAKSELEAVISILKERGPILQARPIQSPAVGVLYTDPVSGDRARQLFEAIMRQRLERLGASPTFVLAALEEEGAVSKALLHLLRAKPTSILIASTTAPAGPQDVIGQAMLRAGCHVERFLAPVEPGNLLLLGIQG